MGLATFVLIALIVVHHERTLRASLGPALLAEARAGAFGDPALPGTQWWELRADGAFEAWWSGARAPDEATRALANEARARGAALLQLGGIGDAIRFAAPVAARRSVAVARLPEATARSLRARPLAIVTLLGAADLAIFSGFAALVLRRRVVRPLEELAAAARAVGAGEIARATVGGPRETAEVALAWNEMTEALERRSEDLAKAVAELRQANGELRRTRAGLDRAERLALVGRLAAGVAHEVGNPIGALLAFMELAARDPGLAEASRGYLARAAREGERVRVILRQLLDFSRPSRPERRAARPGCLRRGGEPARCGAAGEPRHPLRGAAAPGAPLALADAGAVLQVLLNLAAERRGRRGGKRAAGDPARGAADGAARASGRRRCEQAPSRARRRTPSSAWCATTAAASPRADRERIFDPFFTTKPPGQGTGLGLSTAARLAEEMEGALLLVEPPPGFTTAFALRLPVARQPAQSRMRCGGS